MTKQLAKYLQTRAILSPWHLQGGRGGGYDGCVVIPALAESQRLFATLESIAANPGPLAEHFLVVVVVNHREDATKAEKEDNRHTLEHLRALRTPFPLGVVDAATPGLELPAELGGVGLARKIGLDLALPQLKEKAVMACLDADTLVEPGYLRALLDHFRECPGAAVIPFRHQRGTELSEERAIVLYELFLRHYVLGLSYAGSPYAFHTVGSAMACTASAYVKAGGMNRRPAAEDFYFLQQLHKTSGVSRLTGSTVHPSARSSHRVPFGTGKSVSRIVAEGEGSQTFYSVSAFRILRDWLLLVRSAPGITGSELLARSAFIHPRLADYLAAARLPEVWAKLKSQADDSPRLITAFHGWFDALKTVRLIHHLCGAFPREPASEAVPHLLEACRLPVPRGEAAQLEALREMQNGVTTRNHN